MCGTSVTTQRYNLSDAPVDAKCSNLRVKLVRPTVFPMPNSVCDGYLVCCGPDNVVGASSFSATCDRLSHSAKATLEWFPISWYIVKELYV